MLDFISRLYIEYSQFTQNNQMVGASLALWVMTTLTFILRKVPLYIYKFLHRQLITDITLDNSSWEIQSMIDHINEVHRSSRLYKLSRNFSLSSTWSNGEVKASVHAGYGLHFFWLNNRLYWMDKYKLSSQGSEKQKYEYKISTYGRNVDHILTLAKQFTTNTNKSEIVVKSLCLEDGDVYWETSCNVQTRTRDNIITTNNVHLEICDRIEEWRDSKDWYNERGISWKLGLMLEGPPGTGKTSIVKFLANRYNANIYPLPLDKLTKTILDKAVSAIRDNSIILLEDIDAIAAIKDRTVESKDKNTFSPLTLSDILNFLDGVIPLQGCMVIMTTNHIEKIDEAVLRPGRIDYVFSIGLLDKIAIIDYTVKAFNDYKALNLDIPNDFKIKGCELQKLLLANKDDYSGYVRDLTKLANEE